MSSASRLLAILDLFDESRPVWSAEEAARDLNVSVSTAYRYIRALCAAELLVPVSGDGYRIGPAVLKYDRLLRLSDPLIDAGTPVLARVQAIAGEAVSTFLARLFRDRVMCVLAETGPKAPKSISFERGRPMPMFRGATSKIILANLPRRSLKRIYDANKETIAETMGVADWRALLDMLRRIRRAGIAVSRGEVDTGLVGTAAPIFDDQDAVIASLSIVGRASVIDDPELDRLMDLARSAAAEISDSLRRVSATGAPRPAS